MKKTKLTKKLALKAETIRVLSKTELAQIAGGECAAPTESRFQSCTCEHLGCGNPLTDGC